MAAREERKSCVAFFFLLYCSQSLLNGRSTDYAAVPVVVESDGSWTSGIAYFVNPGCEIPRAGSRIQNFESVILSPAAQLRGAEEGWKDFSLRNQWQETMHPHVCLHRRTQL